MRKALREKVSTDYALDYTKRSEIATRLGWKPIPSAARVTRDEVSGL